MKAIIFLCLFPAFAFAADKQVELQTSHGAVLLDIYNPGLASVLLLAPGAGCGPRLDMYDPIAATARSKGFTLVRLYWAYCVAKPQGKPTEDLSKEKEDFGAAFHYVRSDLNYPLAKIVIGGKSQGTFVSQEMFQAEKQLPALLILTPVCTDDETDPKNPKNVMQEAYPALESEIRIVLMAQGDQDPLCHRMHFEEFLAGKGANFSAARLQGDHGFGIKNPDGSYNAELGRENIKALAAQIGAWL
jgi:predicted alpha/beta-hydrolase family hydrolase